MDLVLQFITVITSGILIQEIAEEKSSHSYLVARLNCLGELLATSVLPSRRGIHPKIQYNPITENCLLTR